MDFINKEITPLGIKNYRRLFARHLKELELYHKVVADYFMKYNRSFEQYVLVEKNNLNTILDAVEVLWSAVYRSVNNALKSSIFLLSVITDEKFIYVFSPYVIFDETDKEKFNRYLEKAIKTELLYIEGLTLTNYSKEDLNKFNSIYKKLCPKFKNGKLESKLYKII